jgi:hypothetical protein
VEGLIRGREKPEKMHQLAFDKETDLLLQKAREEHHGQPEDEREGQGGDLDPKLQLLLQLQSEVEILDRDHITVERTALLKRINAAGGGAVGGAAAAAAAAAAGAPPPAPARFGDPLDVSPRAPKARYEFWPSMRDRLPLLYFCAEALLGGSANATAFNERLHSPAALIFSKLRSSLKPDTTERLTLALYYVRERVKAMLAGTTTDYQREMLADKVLGFVPEEEEGAEEEEEEEEEKIIEVP